MVYSRGDHSGRTHEPRKESDEAVLAVKSIVRGLILEIDEFSETTGLVNAEEQLNGILRGIDRAAEIRPLSRVKRIARGA